MRLRRLSAIVGALACFICCGRETAPAGSPPEIALHQSGDEAQSSITVTGLTARELSSLRDEDPGEPSWHAALKVTAGDQATDDLPPVAGKYVVTDESIRFTPLFPFVPGRSYRVEFDPASVGREAAVVASVVRVPPLASAPSTVVASVYPDADVVPENLLRMYIEFSAPMGSSPARDFVRLVDVTGGKEDVVEGAFLPVEAEYWTPDHTRYTLFFDPGRVKDGILPNRQRGRPLKAGRKYALDIAADWKDANRQPLKSAFRHTFQAGPSEKDAIELEDWKLAPPAPGTRDPLSVSFASALDRAIVARALGVETAAHARIAGRSILDENDRRWTFTPDVPWQAGGYNLIAQSFLEDPQGNQIGVPFEIVVDTRREERAPDEFRVAFTIASK